MDRRVKKTKAAIRKAYFELLKDKEDSSISISELARRADIDRKTFYLHYDSTEDIVAEFCEERSEELRTVLKESGFFHDPFDTDTLFGALSSMLAVYMSAYGDMTQNPHYASFWSKVTEMLSETIVDIYRDRVSLTEAELHVFSDYSASGMISVFRRYMRYGGDITLAELSRTVSVFALDGIQAVMKRVR